MAAAKNLSQYFIPKWKWSTFYSASLRDWNMNWGIQMEFFPFLPKSALCSPLYQPGWQNGAGTILPRITYVRQCLAIWKMWLATSDWISVNATLSVHPNISQLCRHWNSARYNWSLLQHIAIPTIRRLPQYLIAVGISWRQRRICPRVLFRNGTPNFYPASLLDWDINFKVMCPTEIPSSYPLCQGVHFVQYCSLFNLFRLMLTP